MSYFQPPEPDYDKYTTRQLLAIPFAVFTLAVLVIIGWIALTGAPVELGMVFVGGTEVRIDVSDAASNDPIGEIENTLSGNSDTITPVEGTGEYIVTFSHGETTAEQIESDIGGNDAMTLSELSEVSPTLGADAQHTALMGLAAAFVLMSLLVILVFRSPIPAAVIIASAVSNITIAVATMNLVGISLAMGTVGALLMLIGYSVDSDILLNTHVLRGDQPSFNDNVHEAMQPGVTMTVTSFSAMVVMAITSWLFGIGLLAEMGFVLAVGLAADLMNTYLMNVGILRWYVNRGDTA